MGIHLDQSVQARVEGDEGRPDAGGGVGPLKLVKQQGKVAGQLVPLPRDADGHDAGVAPPGARRGRGRGDRDECGAVKLPLVIQISPGSDSPAGSIRSPFGCGCVLGCRHTRAGKFESVSESRSGARHCARLRERKVAATSSGRVRASAAGSSRTRAHLPRGRRRHLGSRCGLWICFAPRCAIVADLFCFAGAGCEFVLFRRRVVAV